MEKKIYTVTAKCKSSSSSPNAWLVPNFLFTTPSSIDNIRRIHVIFMVIELVSNIKSWP